MNEIGKELGTALAMAAMLIIAGAGLRILVDPAIFLVFCSRLSEGLVRFREQMQTRSPLARHPRFDWGEFRSPAARKSARLLGLVIAATGLLGVFEQLTRL